MCFERQRDHEQLSCIQGKLGRKTLLGKQDRRLDTRSGDASRPHDGEPWLARRAHTDKARGYKKRKQSGSSAITDGSAVVARNAGRIPV